MKKRDPDDEPPSLLDRIITALLAPLFFNISAVVMIAVYYRDHRYLRWLALRPSSRWLHAAMLFSIVAAIAGFVFGSKGFASFLGHCFYTNEESQQNPLITALIWI